MIINVDISNVVDDMFNVSVKIVLKDNFETTHFSMEKSFYDNSKVLRDSYNFDDKVIL